MSYVILDLEWNGAFSKTADRYVNEIIEIGAVKLDDELNIIDTFSVLIAPRINRRLTGRVKRLTKITNEELRQSGIFFMDAMYRFSVFLGDSVLMTWGTTDILTLFDNYLYYKYDYHMPFLTRYCDVQEFCEKALDKYDEGAQIGLSACAELLGIEFSEGEHHRALADAVVSSECFVKLFDKELAERLTIKADNESFYERMKFKNYFITDLDNPDVDKAQLRFRCDNCGRLAKRTKKWKLRNKSFCADFRCGKCGREFVGRVSFKKRFDSVKVNKKVLEKQQKEAQKEMQKESADSKSI